MTTGWRYPIIAANPAFVRVEEGPEGLIDVSQLAEGASFIRAVWLGKVTR